GVVPNPFTRRVGMEYQVARVGVVELAVYDAVGRLVKTLVDGVHEPGLYTTSWNARDLRGRKIPAGVYFIHFQSDDNKSVEKVVVVR
ncbi:MAG: T9SS type A sorting domain-containing protein, partial [candidate division WOR-3 bacterium]